MFVSNATSQRVTLELCRIQWYNRFLTQYVTHAGYSEKNTIINTDLTFSELLHRTSEAL